MRSGTRPVVRVLTGPTGSGKSDLAMALAERNGWEIVCMDSMQIYRRMDIGTAKPTAEDRKRVPHHLLDLCEPTETFSAAAWRDRAEALLRTMTAEGRVPLLTGGTGLYLRALTHGMGMGGAEADPALRAELRSMAETPGGKEKLHAMLETLDAATAERLPVNDVRRVIRAIEVTKATGIPFSRQPESEAPSPWDFRIAALRWPREMLYDRINRRVDRMIRDGLAGEVEALLREGVPEDAQSMAGLGYKEMIPYLRGQATLAEAADRIRLGTRHYAKRQMTFLRREPLTVYVDLPDPAAEEKLMRFFEEES